MRILPSILTPFQVILFSRIDKEFPPYEIQDIYEVESSLFKKCLSIELYEALIADKVDYSSVTAWNVNTEYIAGDKALFAGIIYNCVTANQGVTPQVYTKNSVWELADLFTTPCYNSLFNETLICRWLALAVMRTSTPHIRIKTTARGLVKPHSETSTTATKDDANDLMVNYAARMNDCLDNIMRYIGKNFTSCDFVGVKDPNEKCACNTKDNNCKTGSYEFA